MESASSLLRAVLSLPHACSHSSLCMGVCAVSYPMFHHLQTAVSSTVLNIPFYSQIFLTLKIWSTNLTINPDSFGDFFFRSPVLLHAESKLYPWVCFLLSGLDQEPQAGGYMSLSPFLPRACPPVFGSVVHKPGTKGPEGVPSGCLGICVSLMVQLYPSCLLFSCSR